MRSTGEVLIAGSFTAVGGTARVRLANLNGTTGALGSLNVSINNTVNDIELDDAGNVVYVAGTLRHRGRVDPQPPRGGEPGRARAR